MSKSRAALVATALAAFVGSAETRSEQPVSLRVKPVLCITDKRNQYCEMSFVVQWESNRVGHYCLYNDFSDGPLNCWQEESSGRFDEDRVVVENFSYWLTSPQVDARLAEASVEVMTTDSSDRRRNRRNRHAWSIL